MPTRHIMDPWYRLTTYLDQMRENYQNTSQGAKLYIAKLDDAILDDPKSESKRRFPSEDFPETDADFRGCVYVGLTRLTVEKRFDNHLRGNNASWALHNYPSSEFFEECVGELTRKYGFTHLPVEKREKLESWVGYALYQAGYWVWGPHAHELFKNPEKNPYDYDDFLGTGDFV